MQVSLPQRLIFLFLDVPTLKLRIIIVVILLTSRPKIISLTARTTKKLSCLCLKPIYLQSTNKNQKTIFFRYNNISSCRSYNLRQDGTLWGFLFCVGFSRTEKKYVKLIDDDIYNRIRKVKAKNEIIKMNRNYYNADKKYGELNTFMSTMLMTKISLNIWMWRPFHNKSL